MYRTGNEELIPGSAEKYAAFLRPWESALSALYRSPQSAPGTHRYWFGEERPDASDTMREIGFRNGQAKLHEALLALILDPELPAEMHGHLSSLRQFSNSFESDAPQAHQHAPGAVQAEVRSSVAGGFQVQDFASFA